MKKQIVLNEDDIRQTIANSFDTDKDKVTIEHQMETEGYGLSEHLVPVFTVTIEVPMNDQR